MIDAYEIGIQLMLQEDVSAGLAVINRGLAEVDRAIAATSADLVGLVRDAETATKSVAVAVSSRTPLMTTGDQKTNSPAGEISQSEPKQGLLSTPATKAGEKAAAPDTTAAGPVAPVAPAMPAASQQSGGQVGLAPDLREPAVSSSAPVRSAVEETVMSGRQANAKQIQPDATARVAVAQSVPTAPRASDVMPAPAQEILAAEQQPRRSVTPRATPVAFTASVSGEQGSATAGRQSERARHLPISRPAARRERAVAPWSGTDQSGTQAESTRLHERAAAPQSAGRGQTESAGGMVMLDGRLVGQWLSEHMGREASRPPAGTSFFDPRQTPAWNVSGAL